VRAAFPGIRLQVDANGAYTLANKETLKTLDGFDLELIEQPFAAHDLWDHSRLQKELKTPLCLDESILDEVTTRQAFEMGSCRIVNIKVGRVGGMVEVRRIHDFCQDHGMPVWCGGMLESGIGRAHNLHIARCRTSRFPPTCRPAGATTRKTLSSPPSS